MYPAKNNNNERKAFDYDSRDQLDLAEILYAETHQESKVL